MSHAAPKVAIYRDAMRATALGLAINLALGVVKLVGGIVGDAFALVSDSVNSLGDVVTSTVVLGALWIAQRPPDDEHPYGHTRAEAIAGSNVALLVIASALVVAYQALARLGAPHDAPPVWTLWIAGSNVVIKEGLYRYKLRVGRRTQSSAIIAHAWDHRADALSALAVLVGLGLVRVGGPAWLIADELAALVVAGAIIWSGAMLFRSSVMELMDVQAAEPLVSQVRATAAGVAGVADVEKLWLRKTGLEYLADIHIEVDPLLTVHEGHRIGHQVKSRLLAEFPTLRDVLVHLEPHPHAASHDDAPGS